MRKITFDFYMDDSREEDITKLENQVIDLVNNYNVHTFHVSYSSTDKVEDITEEEYKSKDLDTLKLHMRACEMKIADGIEVNFNMLKKSIIEKKIKMLEK